MIKNLTIIGSSHISQESVEEIKTVMNEKSPEIIALELDKNRFIALMTNKTDKITPALITKIGFKGYLFLKLGKWAEHKLGNIVGTKPGVEMKAAIKLANERKCKIALIDQDIQITLKKLSKKFRISRIFIELIKGGLSKRKIPFNLAKVPSDEVINKLLIEFKNRFPGLYHVLLEERNIFMAKRLLLLHNKFPETKILAIVGAGHKKGIKKLLDEWVR